MRGENTSVCEAKTITGNLGAMKTFLALLLVLLLVLVALPIGMGDMGDMGDCPMCTSPKTIALGICAGILSLLVLIVLLGRSRLRLSEQASRRLLLARSIYRPPRFA